MNYIMQLLLQDAEFHMSIFIICGYVIIILISP